MSFDRDKYELHLAAQRAERGLNLGSGRTIIFDPKKHPRDYLGRFREILGGLEHGDKAVIKDLDGREVSVTKQPDGKFDIESGGRGAWNRKKGSTSGVLRQREFVRPGNAAKEALRRSSAAGAEGKLPDRLSRRNDPYRHYYDTPHGAKKDPWRGGPKPKDVKVIGEPRKQPEPNRPKSGPGGATGDTSYIEGGVALPDPKSDKEGYRKVAKEQVDEWVGSWWDNAREIANEAEMAGKGFDFADLSPDFNRELSSDMPKLLPGSKYDAKKGTLKLPNGDVFYIDSQDGAVLQKGSK